MHWSKFVILLLATLTLHACKKDDEAVVSPIPEFVYAGGETTIFDATSNAFSTPAPNLSTENFERHLDGDFAFEQIFVTAPANVNPGLGPIFNNSSCISCHIKDGRSTPADSGDAVSGFLIRLSVDGQNNHGGPKPVPYFGTQLQHRAIFGMEREAGFSSAAITELVEFLDGTTAELERKEYTLTDPYHPLPAAFHLSPRVAPAIFGLGLLEAIPEMDILAKVDESDANGDGISGKANWVWNVELQNHSLGRFGWKALNPTLLQQTAGAFNEDMGITNWLFPEENCAGQSNCEDDGLPDIGSEFLATTEFYCQTLAVPAVRNYEDSEVLRGRVLFEEAKCSACHTPRQVTGTAIIPELSNQIIYPYTDLLLHDMGEGLSDNRPSFEAAGNEWRTPPLWGIGLIPVVNGHSRLLHDGRARNLTEAILWHDGEAAFSKQAFTAMTKEDRNALIKFLESL